MITTCRYAHPSSRGLAAVLAFAFRQPYVPRSKKTIETLVRHARRQGDNRILIIEEENGRVSHLAVIRVDELGRWAWLNRIGVTYDA